MSMVDIGGKTFVQINDISHILSLSNLLDKPIIRNAKAAGKLEILSYATVRSAVVLKDGTVILTPIWAKMLRNRIHSLIW